MRIGKSLLCLVAFSFALAAFAKVSVDFDKKADFTKYKTYAWLEGKGTPAPNRLTEQKIISAVEEQLEAKGLTKAEGEADLKVVTHATTSTSLAMDAATFGYGGYYGWGGFTYWGTTTSVNMRDITTGTLLVDLVDGGTNLLVWRGVATETIPSMPDPKKIQSKIKSVTKKMFWSFPPKAKK